MALEQRFPSLVSEKSPTQKVGAPPAAKFAKVRHAVRMLSLGNVFTDEEARDFVGRVRRFLKLGADAPLDVTAEPKIDGLSVSLRYEHGELVQARHARRRQRGRGRHRQCAHHRGHPARS